MDAKLESVAKTADVGGVRRDVENVQRKMEGVVNQVQANTTIATLKTALTALQNLRAAERPPLEKTTREICTGIRCEPSFPPLTRRRSAFQAGAITKEQELGRIRKYEKSRRSLHIWPIAGSTAREVSDKLTTFFEGALQIPSERVKDMGIEGIERIKQSHKLEIYNEVKVTFTDFRTRDWIVSKGKCLAKYVNEEGKPTVGFRLDVPDFLAGDFKALEDYGFSMRSTHGRLTRRYIKYDEEEYSLFMELRLPESPVWLRITPELARELKQQNNREELQQERKQLTARPARRIGKGVMTNFLPRGNKDKAFTVPQDTRGREVTYEQMLERINNKLREESGQRRHKKGWTADMSDVEIVPEDSDQEMPVASTSKEPPTRSNANPPKHKDTVQIPPGGPDTTGCAYAMGGYLPNGQS